MLAFSTVLAGMCQEPLGVYLDLGIIVSVSVIGDVVKKMYDVHVDTFKIIRSKVFFERVHAV